MDRLIAQIRSRTGAKIGHGSQESRDEQHARQIGVLAQSQGFVRLRDEIITRAAPTAGERVLDVGAGTGLLALAVAPSVAHVTAVDSSPAVCRMLEANSKDLALTNVDAVVADARALPLPDASIDLALSNYCLHHISDADKVVALRELARVLRPGGRLVLGDMMFNVGFRTPRDRRVVAHMAFAMVRRRPAGILRLVRNVVRTIVAPAERPASVEWWEQALAGGGFCDVRVVALEHEGGIACARRATSEPAGPNTSGDAGGPPARGLSSDTRTVVGDDGAQAISAPYSHSD